MKSDRLLPILLAFIGSCTLDTDALRGTGHQNSENNKQAEIEPKNDSSSSRIDAGPLDSSSYIQKELDARIPDSQYLDQGIREDARVIGIDAPLINPCYRNDFDSPDSLDTLILQNGTWSRHPKGYLRHNDELESSWRVAYFSDYTFGNFVANVRIRMFDSSFPGAGVDSHHAGIVVRYNPDDGSGYIFQLQHANNNTLQISIDNYLGGNLTNVTINCGEIGCGYQRWYEIESTASGENLVVRLDGREVLNIKDHLHERGFIGFVTYGGREIQYDDFEVCEE